MIECVINGLSTIDMSKNHSKFFKGQRKMSEIQVKKIFYLLLTRIIFSPNIYLLTITIIIFLF